MRVPERSAVADQNDRKTFVASQRPELSGGNNLFRGAAIALGLQGHTARVLISDVLQRSGSSPEKVSLDEMYTLLPELELLVRKLMPAEVALERMQRLQRFLLSITPEE
jgi:hypothetical protein